MRTSRWRRGGIVTVLAAGMLFLTHVSPASATVTGSGAGDGWEFPVQDVPDDCSPGGPPFGPGTVPGDVFELDHNGTFVATSGTNQATYIGPTHVHIAVGFHAIGLAGVGPSCSQPIGPVDVTEASLIGSTTPSGEVTCTLSDFGSGTYTRVQSAVTFHLVFDAGDRCTVKGNTVPFRSTLSGESITLDISGTMIPCDIPELGQCPTTRPTNAGSYLTTSYVAS